jgi:outer membrane lipoprotein SlyB/Ca2+-binding EF-hand superfamily protein
MKRVALLLASTALFSGASLAYGAEANQAAPWLADFRKADLNDSGGVSKVELDKSKSALLKPIKDNFKAVDQDGDGQVEVAEYERFLSRQEDSFAAQFKKADLNDSGGLSRKEIDKAGAKEFALLKKNFDAIDADHDGQVAYAEYQAYRNGGGKGGAAGETRAAAADQCRPDCGYVILVDRYKIEGEGSLLGAVAGGVAGGLLGSQVGSGTGKTVATVGGAAGGAYVGHKVEEKLKTKKMVKVTVKFDSGEQRDFDFEADKSPFPKGARVQVKDGKLTAYTEQ